MSPPVKKLKSPTGLFVQPDDGPPDGVDLWLFARLKGLDARLDGMDDKLDLVVQFSQTSLIAKICEHAVAMTRNENGQMKYIAAILLGLAAIFWSVPATMDATGIHLFADAPTQQDLGVKP